MKREKSFVDKRRKEILEKLVREPELKVEQLAAMFHVSPITIRRDLQFLEDQKLLTRLYGGAAPTKQAGRIAGQDEVSLYRNLIAQYAATLVEDEDSIFINTSRNALSVIHYIDKQNMR